MVHRLIELSMPGSNGEVSEVKREGRKEEKLVGEGEKWVGEG